MSAEVRSLERARNDAEDDERALEHGDAGVSAARRLTRVDVASGARRF